MNNSFVIAALAVLAYTLLICAVAEYRISKF